MERVVTTVSITFFGVGALVLAGGIVAAVDTRHFLAQANRVPGEVIAMEEERSSRNDLLHAPVFRFTSRAGQEVVFRGSASAPPRYHVGEEVQIGYVDADPTGAREISFSSLWGGSVFAAAFGGVFSLVGGGILARRKVKAARDAALRRDGTPVQTDFQSVERNGALKVNGRNPWQIVTQWKHPSTGELHLFKSNNLWFDPTSHISTQKITVYLDPQRPKRFYMDVSFLPKLKG